MMKIKIEDAYYPLGCDDFIDIQVTHNGRIYRGLLRVKEENQ